MSLRSSPDVHETPWPYLSSSLDSLKQFVSKLPPTPHLSKLGFFEARRGTHLGRPTQGRQQIPQQLTETQQPMTRGDGGETAPDAIHCLWPQQLRMPLVYEVKIVKVLPTKQ